MKRKILYLLTAIAIIFIIAAGIILTQKDFSKETGKNETENFTIISYYHGSGYGIVRSYRITESDGKLYFTKSVSGLQKGQEVYAISDKDLEELAKIIESNGIRNWNGFNESDSRIDDGDGFNLVVNFENETITASGYMMYPANYKVGHEALLSYFETLSASKKPLKT